VACHVFAALEVNMTTMVYRTFVQRGHPELGDMAYVTEASNIPGLVAESEDLETLYAAVDIAAPVLIWTNLLQKKWPMSADIAHEIVVIEGNTVTRNVRKIDLGRAANVAGL
jgi:hypothetical protein